jgi:hypothetical protein
VSVGVMELLLEQEQGPAALKMVDTEGNTPIHIACHQGMSMHSCIRLMIARDPSSLHIANNSGKTALHLAFDGHVWMPLETLRLMVKCSASSCLILDTFLVVNEDANDGAGAMEYQRLLPYDRAISEHREASRRALDAGFGRPMHQYAMLVDLLAEATIDALCALMECALSTRANLHEDVNYFQDDILGVIPNFEASSCGVVLTERLRPYVDPDMVRELINKPGVQTLLKEDQDLQSLICGLVRMHKSGRNYFLEDPGDRPKGVCVMESASGNVDCLFLHVRENSLALCDRQQFFHTTSSNTMVTSSTTMVAQPNCRNETERLYGTNEMCTNCNVLEKYSRGKKLFRCGSCHQVLYCSRECQRAHWKKMHKKECVGTKKKK